MFRRQTLSSAYYIQSVQLFPRVLSNQLENDEKQYGKLVAIFVLDMINLYFLRVEIIIFFTLNV